MNGPAIEAYASKAEALAAAADALAAELNAGLSARGVAAAALSGGSTPAPAYEALASRDLDWLNVTFALVDERFVPLTDPGSNEAMLRRTLARPLAAGAKLAPLWSQQADCAADAAAIADQTYAQLSFDVALLGMGTDAHTASWFPQNPALPVALDPDAAQSVIDLEAPGAAGAAARLTITMAALQRTHRILLLITGAEKRERLEWARDQPPQIAPIAAVLDAFPERLSIFWGP